MLKNDKFDSIYEIDLTDCVYRIVANHLVKPIKT